MLAIRAASDEHPGGAAPCCLLLRCVASAPVVGIVAAREASVLGWDGLFPASAGGPTVLCFLSVVFLEWSLGELLLWLVGTSGLLLAHQGSCSHRCHYFGALVGTNLRSWLLPAAWQDKQVFGTTVFVVESLGGGGAIALVSRLAWALCSHGCYGYWAMKL